MINQPQRPRWIQYALAFCAGVFLMNLVPHFLMGITGHWFPTPFAEPPGEGLSNPVTNVLWASINLVLGLVLAHFSRVARFKIMWLPLGLGALLMAFYLASYFGGLGLW